jgi:Protein of unknown function (DUF1579)
MSVPASLSQLEGHWTGEGTLFVPWLTPPESHYSSTASISTAGGGFLRVEYAWAHEGKPHDGLLLLTDEKKDGAVAAVWIDSWHQSQSFLFSNGRVDPAGAVAVLGSYPAPDGPDWGWRTEVRPVGNGFELLMYNITPDGEEALAVRNRYERRT